MGIGLSGKVPALCWASGPDTSSALDGLLGPHNEERSWADLCCLPGKGQKLACHQGPDCLLDQVPPSMQDNPLKGTRDDLIKSDRFLKNH